VHLNFEENQEFTAFVNCQLSIVNGKAINKQDENFGCISILKKTKNLTIFGNR